ncbi:MAG TPA: hypothetical protein VHT70_04215 [Candidatus Saccharimonadales bacterium]|jgi:hypothetical protein|nr:hypothetical protein [Candidatus Saccharimonadales bacterium]
MSAEFSLHGNEYYKKLVDLRDQALGESYSHGSRIGFGAIASIGSIEAEWSGVTGDNVKLTDRGIRVFDHRPFSVYPTTLEIFGNPVAAESTDITENPKLYAPLTRYKLEIDEVGDIQKYVGRYDRVLDVFLQDEHVKLTEDDRQRILDELERGASGDFTLYPHADEYDV